jgi:hypothetical protein
MDIAARQADTGDALITRVTEAATVAEAQSIVRAASVQARYSAADLLYLDADSHSMPWLRAHIVSEARA